MDGAFHYLTEGVHVEVEETEGELGVYLRRIFFASVISANVRTKELMVRNYDHASYVTTLLISLFLLYIITSIACFPPLRICLDILPKTKTVTRYQLVRIA